MAATAEIWPALTDGEACYKRLEIQTKLPDNRIEAWNTHIHPIIEKQFSNADLEYPEALKKLCNSAFYIAEQSAGKIFEDYFWTATMLAWSKLAPALLDAQKKTVGTVGLKTLKAQSCILVKMITLVPKK